MRRSKAKNALSPSMPRGVRRVSWRRQTWLVSLLLNASTLCLAQSLAPQPLAVNTPTLLSLKQSVSDSAINLANDSATDSAINRSSASVDENAGNPLRMPHPAPTIPFKKESAGLAEQSLSAFLTTLLLLAITIAGLYFLRNFLRKKMPQTLHLNSALQVKERLKLNRQLEVYVLVYREREIILAHSGTHTMLLGEFSSAPMAANTPDIP